MSISPINKHILDLTGIDYRLSRPYSTSVGTAKSNKIPGRESILMLIKNVNGSLVDTIGLSIGDYALLDPYWQSFFFDDPTTPKTTVTAADVIADPNINIPGGNVFYSTTRNIIVIYGTSPAEEAERRLWKYLFDTQFEPVLMNGAPYLINNYPLYVGA